MRPRGATPAAIAAITAILAVTLLGACGAPGPDRGRDPGAVIEVVATTNVWGDIAAQLGGDLVRVESLVDDPVSDPHLFEPDARDAAAIARAEVVITNGLGYDTFADRLIASAPSASAKVLRIADVLRVRGDDVDPHLWYDVRRIPEVARAITSRFAAARPDSQAAFAANLAVFEASLRPLLDAVADLAARHAGAPVAYTERVAGYLLRAAGLADATPAGFAPAIEEGNEPSPAAAKAMTDLVANHRIRALLHNPQTTGRATDAVRDRARAAGVAVVAMTETLPASTAGYQTWQLDQVQRLRAALDGAATDRG